MRRPASFKEPRLRRHRCLQQPLSPDLDQRRRAVGVAPSVLSSFLPGLFALFVFLSLVSARLHHLSWLEIAGCAVAAPSVKAFHFPCWSPCFSVPQSRRAFAAPDIFLGAPASGTTDICRLQPWLGLLRACPMVCSFCLGLLVSWVGCLFWFP